MKVYILFSRYYMDQPDLMEVESISFSYDAADNLKQKLEETGPSGFSYRIQEMDTIDELK